MISPVFDLTDGRETPIEKGELCDVFLNFANKYIWGKVLKKIPWERILKGWHPAQRGSRALCLFPMAQSLKNTPGENTTHHSQFQKPTQPSFTFMRCLVLLT